jgi:hypothetical protein
MTYTTTTPRTAKNRVPVLPVVTYRDGKPYDQRERRVVYGNYTVTEFALSPYVRGLRFANAV